MNALRLPKQVWRRGIADDPPLRTPLRAGPLDLSFERGELRFIRLGRWEVVNRIYVAVRDRNWDTAAPVLSNIVLAAKASAFRISFDVSCRMREIDFAWKGTIAGDHAGTITFAMDGEARATFMRNRIGFCILHPDTCAGARCVLKHPDGTATSSTFPRFISPHQPFLDLSGISHEVVPGTWAELSFDGDVFETEDQRNWTDASFKTYCTPLNLPYPAQISAGTPVRQSVTLRLREDSGERLIVSSAPRRQRAIHPSYEIHAGQPTRQLPPIGLCAASHGGALSRREASRLAAMKLDHIRVEVDLSLPGWRDSLRMSAAQATDLGTGLIPALHLSDAAEAELAALADFFAHERCEIRMWLVFRRGEPCTADRWVERARAVLGTAFPGASFASGTNAYFTELNRGIPPGTPADCLVYSVNPQIHAFDDTSVIETLSAQAATVESALRISGGRPIAVSPVTLRPRFNAVATGPLPPVAPGELPPQVDPRQMSLLGAAWTLGSISSLVHGGASLLTYFETTGWRGVMETEEGPSAPDRFPALPGCVFPLYHVLADIGEMKGGGLLPGRPDPASALAGLAIRTEARRRVLLANLGSDTIMATVPSAEGGLAGRARVKCLDETTVERACRSPEEFRAKQGTAKAPRGGNLEIDLLPYAVARIDWED